MRRLIPIVVLLLSLALPAAAKSTAADRYDVTIRTVADGSIQVTETLHLQFSGGPFTFVSRMVPLRNTDGVEVLGASMDGKVMTRGENAGQFDVRRRDAGIAVRWHFTSTSDARHEFRLSYVVRGAIRRERVGGIIEWQALPGEHAYAIAKTRIVLEGEGIEREPSIRTRRVAGVNLTPVAGGWAIDGQGVQPDGWIAVATAVPLAANVMPQWQARALRQRALAPRMLMFAALALVVSVAFVLLIWHQYPAGPPAASDTMSGDAPPASRPPAIAAAVLAGGHSTNAHSVGTVIDLASRGVLTIAEAERQWTRVRRFTLTRQPSAGLAPHESALLEVMFRQEETIDFSRAASRLARGGKAFRRAVNQELERLGLVDEERRAVRRRLFVIGAVTGILGVAALAIALVLVPDAGPWALAIMLPIELSGALALALGVTRPELSDEGFRERDRWRAFRRTLKEEIAGGSIGSPDANAPDAMRWLPYVAALGLALPLSRLLKKKGASAVLPSWFQSLAGRDRSVAFAAFLGTASVSTSAGAAAGSRSAGGGSSGAG